NGTRIGDDAVPLLELKTGLQQLQLTGTRISKAGFQKVQRALPANCQFAWGNPAVDFPEYVQYQENGFTQAIASDPKNAQLFLGRSTLRVVLKNLDGAIDDLTEAIRLDPTSGIAYHDR